MIAFKHYCRCIGINDSGIRAFASTNRGKAIKLNQMLMDFTGYFLKSSVDSFEDFILFLLIALFMMNVHDNDNRCSLVSDQGIQELRFAQFANLEKLKIQFRS